MEHIEEMDKNIRESTLPEGENWKAYWAYREGIKRNLDCPDITDFFWEREVEPIVNTFRRHGIKKFTFSCTATNSIEDAMRFVEAGCRLEGIENVFYMTSERYNREKHEREEYPVYRAALVFSL